MSSIWGKIAGGAIGFALGGPLGALLGAIGGHIVDRRLRQGDDGFAQIKSNVDRQAIFTMGVVALGAKMAKADGQVTQDEVRAFKKVFRVRKEDEKNIGKFFDLAKKDVYDFEVYARQLAGLLRDEPVLLKEILWCLAEIAKADGVIHKKEREFLAQIANIFGVSAAEFEQITEVDLFGARNDPYKVLGVSPHDSLDDIKKAYRKLARQHHPDSLMAKGVPQEMIDIANQKIAKINDAYSEIEKSRSS